MATGLRSKISGSPWKRTGPTPTPKRLRLENGLHSKQRSLSGLTGNAGHTQKISVHVVKSPSVCWETADWRGLFSIHAFLAVAIGDIAFVICLVGRDRFAKGKWR